MKKLVLILLSAFLAQATPVMAQHIRFATLAAPDCPQRIVAEQFKKILEAVSQHAWTVSLEPEGLSAERSIDNIQTNALQMGVLPANAFENLDPITRVISFPFLFNSEEQATAILDGHLGGAILRDIETINCKGLGFAEGGFRYISNNIRPVKTVADLDQLRIRVTGNPIFVKTWEALHAAPRPMPWPIFAELEQGVVDGQESPLWIVKTYRFFDVQQYLTLTKHVYIAHIAIASLKWWQTLNGKDQQMIKEAMSEAIEYQRVMHRASELSCLQQLEALGMVIEKHPDIEAFRAQTAPLKTLPYYAEPRVQVVLSKMQEAVASLSSSAPPNEKEVLQEGVTGAHQDSSDPSDPALQEASARPAGCATNSAVDPFEQPTPQAKKTRAPNEHNKQLNLDPLEVLDRESDSIPAKPTPQEETSLEDPFADLELPFSAEENQPAQATDTSDKTHQKESLDSAFDQSTRTSSASTKDFE